MALDGQSPHWSDSELPTVLAISAAEASSGTTRTLTLPDGRKVVVRVPAGACDGQRISVQEAGGPGAPPMTLVLLLSVVQANAPGVPDMYEPTMRASNPDLAPPKNPSPTPTFPSSSASSPKPWLEQEQIPLPPPPPAFQKTWTPTPPTSRKRGAKLRNAVLAALALLLILGGLGIFTIMRNGQQAAAQSNSTATAQALVRANASATVLSDNTTATAETNAIATQNAINSGQATATAVAYQNFYTTSTSGAPAFNDPLRDNSRGNGWSEGTSTGGGGCQFSGGAYHATISNNSFFESCDTTSASLANFAYSVQMKIVQGDCGGVLFREADLNNGKFYYWRVCQQGTYNLLLYTNNTGGTAKTLLSSSIPSFHTGLNASNLLTVIAKGQSIYLYVNKQLVESINDATYLQGHLGMSADSLGSSPTDVAYTNAEVWKL